MTKKYVRYYLVTKKGGAEYRKLESDLPFSEKEGADSIKENVSSVVNVTHISKKKASSFFQINRK